MNKDSLREAMRGIVPVSTGLAPVLPTQVGPLLDEVQPEPTVDFSTIELVVILLSAPLEPEEMSNLTTMGKVHTLTADDVYHTLDTYTEGDFQFLLINIRDSTLFNWLLHQTTVDHTLFFSHVYFFEKILEEDLHYPPQFTIDRVMQHIPSVKPSMKLFIEAMHNKKQQGPASLVIELLLWMKKKFLS